MNKVVLRKRDKQVFGYFQFDFSNTANIGENQQPTHGVKIIVLWLLFQ